MTHAQKVAVHHYHPDLPWPTTIIRTLDVLEEDLVPMLLILMDTQDKAKVTTTLQNNVLWILDHFLPPHIS